MAERCAQIFRVSIHASVTVGGATIGRCEHEVLPGMLYCPEHANQDAMAYHIRYLWKKVEAQAAALKAVENGSKSKGE